MTIYKTPFPKFLGSTICWLMLIFSTYVSANSTYLCEVDRFYLLTNNGLETPPDPSSWIGQKFTVNRFTGAWEGFLNLKDPPWTPVVWSTGTLDGEFFVGITWYGQKSSLVKTPFEFARASVHLTIRPPSEYEDDKVTRFLLKQSSSSMTGTCEFL